MSFNTLVKLLKVRKIDYIPDLARELKSVEATLLIQQVFYYWNYYDKQPFYKFKTPCKHPDYREGQSWLELMGMELSKLKSAWKAIGLKVDTKLASTLGFEKISDAVSYMCDNPEWEDILVFYWKDRTNRTWYALSEKNLESLLIKSFSTKKESIKNYFEVPETQQPCESQNQEFGNDENDTSYIYKVDNKDKNIKKENSPEKKSNTKKREKMNVHFVLDEILIEDLALKYLESSIRKTVSEFYTFYKFGNGKEVPSDNWEYMFEKWIDKAVEFGKLKERSPDEPEIDLEEAVWKVCRDTEYLMDLYSDEQFKSESWNSERMKYRNLDLGEQIESLQNKVLGQKEFEDKLAKAIEMLDRVEELNG